MLSKLLKVAKLCHDAIGGFSATLAWGASDRRVQLVSSKALPWLGVVLHIVPVPVPFPMRDITYCNLDHTVIHFCIYKANNSFVRDVLVQPMELFPAILIQYSPEASLPHVLPPLRGLLRSLDASGANEQGVEDEMLRLYSYPG